VDDKERKELYSNVFNTEAGRKVLKDLAESSGLFSVMASAVDSHGILSYNEGRRSVVKYICRQIKLKMTLEA